MSTCAGLATHPSVSVDPVDVETDLRTRRVAPRTLQEGGMQD